MLAMSKRTRRPPSGPPVDLGTAIRRERGDVVVEFRPDPDNPQRGTVKGARASQGGHDYLWRRGSIDDTQHEAAVRYSDAYHGQVKSGCQLAAAMDGGIRLPPHQQGHPSEGMVDNASTIRQADFILGRDASALVQMVVIEGMPLFTIGEAAGEHDRIALGRLRGALDRLAELWDLA